MECNRYTSEQGGGGIHGSRDFFKQRREKDVGDEGEIEGMDGASSDPFLGEIDKRQLEQLAGRKCCSRALEVRARSFIIPVLCIHCISAIFQG